MEELTAKCSERGASRRVERERYSWASIEGMFKEMGFVPLPWRYWKKFF